MFCIAKSLSLPITVETCHDYMIIARLISRVYLLDGLGFNISVEIFVYPLSKSI